MNNQEALLKFNSIEGGLAEEVLRGTKSGAEMVGSVDIPAKFEGNPVKKIAAKAFYMCPKITSVTIAEGLEEIGESAFYGCKGITEIVIPDSITSIGSNAFLYCEKLVSVKMSANVKSIGDNAFANCPLLENITIPKNVQLGRGVFFNCNNLRKDD